ncbi:RagB/SusD family nutrient uptake outer membrane protein [Aliifodinibius sp. S!AR15-10]|uniref:RagB/SusD family nutrient uptake outer membrane protein n=1 Tax=Aliifodinibius sp. S!AR15-10 TaxID=2950437 RepID=UPI00285FE80E|nr:RagB/SusD family nutrient uptake outer membrane protein [Aliifodinibius sp. S!AR15-10]MDR8393611.1 RagB/SusD family nutrient uptake outer membrane protein [Aliifodinibius sp. S!AR15-10]
MKSVNRLLIAIVGIIIFSACQDFISKAPLEGPSAENFFSSEEELVMGVNAAYNYISPRMADFPYSMEDNTDIVMSRVTNEYQIFRLGELFTTSDVFEEYWDRSYQGINRSNVILNNGERAQDDTSPELFNRIMAEARVIRAVNYFELIQKFGDVPLITETPTLEEAGNIERTSKSQILEFILTELDEAAADLPNEYQGSEIGRVTKGSALAIKTRAALYNEMYDVAIDAAEKVMNLGVYSLHPSFSELFSYEGQYSDEIILADQYLQGERAYGVSVIMGRNTSPGAWSGINPTQHLVSSFEATDGLPIDESPLYDPTNPFVNRDPRLAATVLQPRVWDGTEESIKTYGTIFDGREYMSTHDPELIPHESYILDRNSGEMIANQDVLHEWRTKSGYNLKKYVNEEDAGNASSKNVILYRYADVLLMYAEAKIESGEIDQTVLDAINRVRARAYEVGVGQTGQYPAITTTSQSELREIIRRERIAELAFEGLRYEDLKRWGLMEEVYGQDNIWGRPGNYTELEPDDIPEIDENGMVDFSAYAEEENLLFMVTTGRWDPAYMLWPIPQSEIDLNPNLTQNPGY